MSTTAPSAGTTAQVRRCKTIRAPTKGCSSMAQAPCSRGSSDGFKRFVQSPVVLDLNREARINAVMELGALNESVSVTGDAPPVNTSDASIGRTVDNAEIVTLPLVNRNVYSLLNVTPGVDN